MRLHQVLTGGLLILAAALPVSAAGPFGGERGFGFRAQQQQQRPRPLPQRDVDRRQPQRDAGKDGRMSPEERQQLRRDIGDAGKDIYRGPAPRRQERRGQ